jgi:hypothetical protein
MGTRIASTVRAASVAAATGVVVVLAGPGCVSSSTNPPVDGGAPSFDANLGFDANVVGPGDATVIFTDSSIPDSSFANDVSVGDDGGGSGDGSGGGCPPGWTLGDHGACVVRLDGTWMPSTDANSDGPDTVATIASVTAKSVSVAQSHTGTDYADCGCNAQHLNVPLGATFDCAKATLQFDYATTVAYGSLNTPAIDVRFCTGPCPAVDGGIGGPYFWTGPQFVGSPAAPMQSACGYEWENDAGTASLNYFPASAAIANNATTTVPLSSYVAPASGDRCTGTFDTIDVHVQVYNCAAAQTGTTTVSNVRVF